MIYGLIIFALLTAAFAQAQSPQSQLKPPENEVKSDSNSSSGSQAESLVLASNSLGFQIFQEIKKGEENLVFSPYSLSIALGMAYAGADGSTQSQMARVLRIPLRAESIGHSFNLLSKVDSKNLRKSSDDLTLTIANSLWIQRGQPILPTFTKTILTDYKGLLKTVDFNAHA
jgi:serpin B